MACHKKYALPGVQGYQYIPFYGDLRVLILQGPRRLRDQLDIGSTELVYDIRLPNTGEVMTVPAEGIREEKWNDNDW